MMRGINRDTMLSNNQHNQPVVAWKKGCKPDIILTSSCFVFWFCFFFFSPLACPTAFLCSIFLLPFFLPVSLPQSLSLPSLRSRLLGFLAEHRDRRKGKKKTEGRIYEGHPCWSVQPSTSLQITLTLCMDSKRCCGSHFSLARLQWHIILLECHSDRDRLHVVEC